MSCHGVVSALCYGQGVLHVLHALHVLGKRHALGACQAEACWCSSSWYHNHHMLVHRLVHRMITAWPAIGATRAPCTALAPLQHIKAS